MTSPITMTAGRETVETRIRRFPRFVQRRLRKMVKGSSRFNELLFSFPAASFVLVAGTRGPMERGLATKCVKEGRSLDEVAAALRLPLWMRKLPPEAFSEPLGELPSGPEFVRRIANLAPQESANTAMWLAWLMQGAHLAGEDFALWLAGQKIYKRDVAGANKAPLTVLAAYAWFSQIEGSIGRGLIATPWHMHMSFTNAVDHARVWFERIVFDYCREAQAASGTWHKERKSCGYRFVPLQMPAELRAEGERMNNCVATYAEKVARGACLIYSMRRGGLALATLEITPGQAGRGQAVIAQLLARSNTPVADDIRRAAEAWLAKQGRYPFAAGLGLQHMLFVQSRWSEVWQPWLDAKPALKLGFADPYQAARRLREELDALAKIAKAARV